MQKLEMQTLPEEEESEMSVGQTQRYFVFLGYIVTLLTTTIAYYSLLKENMYVYLGVHQGFAPYPNQ